MGMIPLLASEFDACLELEQEQGEKDLFQSKCSGRTEGFNCLAERKNRWLLREHLGIAVLYLLLPENQRHR